MSKWNDLKRLAEAATPGPWGYDGSYICPARVEGETTYVESWHAVADSHQTENVRYIAAANPAAMLELIAEVEGLERWKKEAVDVMSPVLDYAEGLKIAKLGQSVTQALIADHKRLHAEHQFELERHRTTWTQLDQAKRLMSDVRNGLSCDSVHHAKADRHGVADACPVLARIDAFLEAAK